MSSAKASLFSFGRHWPKTAMFGVGIGWSPADYTACFIVCIRPWVAIAGPHMRSSVKHQSTAREV